MTQVQIILRAVDHRLVAAWERAFRGEQQVEVSLGSVLTRQADAIVSPANSFGYMDGGLDLIYSQHFGWELEARVRRRILEERDGELPVGQALIVPTNNADIPLLISAPTMRVPMNLSGTTNAYLAFRAVLIAVREHNRTAVEGGEAPIRSVLCPGLGTGEGRMPHDRCARQMRAAYEAIVHQHIETKGGLARAVEGHIELMK